MQHSNVYKWSAIDRITNSVLTFTGNIVLARLLDPDDFGLLAMVAIFIALAQNISGCGLSDGLIHKTKPTQRDYSTVFVFNLSMGLIFGVAFIATSQYVADFFNSQPLKDIMVAIGICFFFQALSLTQEARMRKELKYKTLSVVHLSATFTSVVLGIVLALLGYGYWGLVSTRVFLMFFTFVYFIIATKWMPRLCFSGKSFKELFNYGFHLMISYVCTQIGRNINMSVLGKYSPVSHSGLYSQAQKLEEVPFTLTDSIFNMPFFPVLSNTPGEIDRKRLAYNMHACIIFVNAVVAALLFSIGGYAFTLFYGTKWAAAVPVFQLLLVFGMMSSIKYFYHTILKVYGKTKIIRNLTIAEVVLQIALLLLVYDKGLLIIATAQIVPVVFAVIYFYCIYRKIYSVKFGEFYKQVIYPILLPLLPMAVTILMLCLFISSLGCFFATLLGSLIFLTVLTLECEILKPSFYLSFKQFLLRKK